MFRIEVKAAVLGKSSYSARRFKISSNEHVCPSCHNWAPAFEQVVGKQTNAALINANLL